MVRWTWTLPLLALTLGGCLHDWSELRPADAGEAPTLVLRADVFCFERGDTGELRWEATSAERCTASGLWSGARATRGTLTIEPERSGEYVLECEGPTGRARRAVPVVVMEAGDVTALWATRTNDGRLDWSGVPRACLGQPHPGLASLPASDLRAAFQVVWDLESLHVRVEVGDDVVDVGPSVHSYESDGVEVLLDLGEQRAIPDPRDRQIGVRADGAVFVAPWFEPTTATGLRARAEPLDDGYALELSIDWAYLDDPRGPPTSLRRYGLELVVNERDMGTRQPPSDPALYFRYVERHYARPDAWGTLILGRQGG